MIPCFLFYLQIQVTNVLGEPVAAHSIGCIWDFSAIAFQCCRDFNYCLMSTFFGVCIAATWGCQFAFLAFEHVWFFSPIVQAVTMTWHVFTRCGRVWCRCCVYPWTRACSYCFVAFKSDNVDYDAIDNPPMSHRVQKIKIVQDEPPTNSTPVVNNTVDDDSGGEKLNEDVYLGNKAKMCKSVNRQLML